MAEKIWGNNQIELLVVDVEELEYLENNPRYMPDEKFERLVENIKRDGYLSSVPFCIKIGENKYKILSGNHRVRAAKLAGLERIIIMVPNRSLPESKQKAIALSHNALVGADDPFLLKRMYEAIKDTEDKLYSGIDAKQVQRMIASIIKPEKFSSIDYDFQTMTLLFLPNDIEDLENILNQAEMLLRNKDVYVGRYKDFEIIKKAIAKSRVEFNIKNKSVALFALIEYGYNKLQEEVMKDGFEGKENEN